MFLKYPSEERSQFERALRYVGISLLSQLSLSFSKSSDNRSRNSASSVLLSTLSANNDISSIHYSIIRNLSSPRFNCKERPSVWVVIFFPRPFKALETSSSVAHLNDTSSRSANRKAASLLWSSVQITPLSSFQRRMKSRFSEE